MTDGNTTPGGSPLNYAANSNKSKQPDKAPEPAALAPVVQNAAVERQQPVGQKFFKAFANDTVGSVGAYLLMDVIVPATKNLISDLVTQGINRMLYGSSRGGSSTFQQSRQSYTRFSGGGGSTQTSAVASQQAYSQQAKATQDTTQLVFTSRVDAEMTLDSLRELIERYGSAKLVNLYQAARVPTDFTDHKYGWTDLSRAQVQQIRQGYIIDLPRPIVLP